MYATYTLPFCVANQKCDPVALSQLGVTKWQEESELKTLGSNRAKGKMTFS